MIWPMLVVSLITKGHPIQNGIRSNESGFGHDGINNL